MKKMMFFIAIVTAISFQALTSFGQTQWGPWNNVSCFKGLQFSVKYYGVNKVVNQNEWNIKMRNNYGEKVDFDLSITFGQDVQLLGNFTVAANAERGYTSFYSKDPSTNPRVQVKKVCFPRKGLGCGSQKYEDCYAECDEGSPHVPTTCSGSNSPDGSSESSNTENANNSSDKNPSQDSNGGTSKNGGANQNSNTSTQANANSNGLNADALKRKIIENLRNNLQEKSITTQIKGSDQSDSFSNISISENNSLITIKATVTYKISKNTFIYVTIDEFTITDSFANLRVEFNSNSASKPLYIYSDRCEQFTTTPTAGRTKTNCYKGRLYCAYNAGNNNENFNELTQLIEQLKSISGK